MSISKGYVLRNFIKSSRSGKIGNHCNLWGSPCSSPDNYCSVKPGECERPDDQYNGICQAKPDACTAKWDPVCGCNGKTYGNKCVADSKAANVWHTGSCEYGKQCSFASPCKNTEEYFCKIPDGMCVDDQTFSPVGGTCTPHNGSGGCTANGCDGKVYYNACKASAVEGVNVSHNLDPNDESVVPGGDCEIGEKKRAKDDPDESSSSTSSSSKSAKSSSSRSSSSKSAKSSSSRFSSSKSRKKTSSSPDWAVTAE